METNMSVRAVLCFWCCAAVGVVTAVEFQGVAQASILESRAFVVGEDDPPWYPDQKCSQVPADTCLRVSVCEQSPYSIGWWWCAKCDGSPVDWYLCKYPGDGCQEASGLGHHPCGCLYEEFTLMIPGWSCEDTCHPQLVTNTDCGRYLKSCDP